MSMLLFANKNMGSVQCIGTEPLEGAIPMFISMRSIRGAAAGALGAGALTGVMLFGAIPEADAAPAPVPASSFAFAGPQAGLNGISGISDIQQAPAISPTRWGHGGGGGWGHGGFGRGGWGHGGGGWGAAAGAAAVGAAAVGATAAGVAVVGATAAGVAVVAFSTTAVSGVPGGEPIRRGGRPTTPAVIVVGRPANGGEPMPV